MAASAGLSQADAEKRVDEVTARAKADTDAARKVVAYFSIFTALSMLIGAFIAAAAAALGGQHRDEPWRSDIGRVEYR
jgi:heme A synthase